MCLRWLSVVVACIGFSVSSLRVSADIAGLLPRVPADANAIVAINVKSVMDSPVAKAAGWGTKEGDTPLFLPRYASNVLFAASFNFGKVDTDWEIGLVETEKEVSLASIQLAESGTEDTLSAIPALWSTRRAYFLAVNKNLIGIASPDDRRFAVKFASQQLNPRPTAVIPAYLVDAAGSVRGSTNIVMALSFSDSLSFNRTRRNLAMNLTRATILKGASINDIAKVLVTGKGVTLRVSVDKEINARLNVDFGTDPSLLKPVALPLLADVLTTNGLALKDVETWETSISGNSIVYTGKLSATSLRHIVGLIETQTPTEPTKGDTSTAAVGTTGSAAPVEPSQAAIIDASKKYYKQISSILDAVPPVAAAGETAGWMRRAAQRIDRLPLVNVDPELTNWGIQVSATLLNGAQALATGQSNINAAVTAAHNANSVNYDQYYDSYYGRTYDNVAASTVKQTAAKNEAVQAERARTVAPVNQLLAELIATRSRIRAAMVAKYKVEF